MPLFRKKSPAASNEAALREIEASVRLIRSRMGENKMAPGDLFAMIGEDERPILAAMPAQSGSEPERVLPGQAVVAASDAAKGRRDAHAGQLNLGSR